MILSIRPPSRLPVNGIFFRPAAGFIGFLIEHYAGNFPLWLAPDQVRVITLNDDEALINCAQPIVAELRANMVRVDADFSATPFKAKISNAEQLRVHTMLVIGGRDMAAGQVSRLPSKSNTCNCWPAKELYTTLHHNRHEGSIPFTRSIHNQRLTQKCK